MKQGCLIRLIGVKPCLVGYSDKILLRVIEICPHPVFDLRAVRHPAAAKRTWQQVMDEIPKLKTGETKNRWFTAIKEHAFDSIRDRVMLETQPEHFLKVLENGSVCTNIYLRRIHNFAMDMSWLPWPVVPKKRWPAIKFKDKRGITLAEHLAITTRELNPERRAFSHPTEF
jgi:hypothetical protein